eukprot:UN10905
MISYRGTMERRGEEKHNNQNEHVFLFCFVFFLCRKTLYFL